MSCSPQGKKLRLRALSSPRSCPLDKTRLPAKVLPAPGLSYKPSKHVFKKVEAHLLDHQTNQALALDSSRLSVLSIYLENGETVAGLKIKLPKI